MSYKQWRGAIAPKVQGSWNLHQLLPKGMDFFVMLSDLGALTGARGHANYAAGNSFQSGLAQHRVAIGEKAVALGLGGVSSGAAMHDNVGVRERETQRMRFYPLEEWDLLAVLDQYCHPHAVPFSSSGCHTTVGILRPVQERGYGRPNWATLPMFNHLTLSTLFDMPEKPNFAKLIGWAFSLGEAEDAVTVELRVKLGEFLSMSPDELDPNRPISQYGMDPLFIIHLRGWIATELRARVERSELEGDATIRSVAVRVVQNSEYAKAEWEYHRYERQLYSPAELDGIGLPFMRWGM